MANTDVAWGLTPVRYRSGAPYNGAANKYYVPASDGTALFLGDPVISAGSADALGRYASVTRATAGSAGRVRGVVVGVEPVTQDSLTYRAASTERYVWVADDPTLVFEIQEDSTGGALAVTDIGLNADLASGTGSTVTGRSGFELDTNTKATTATLQLRIIGLVAREDNEVGTNAKVLVSINTHELTADSAGI